MRFISKIIAYALAILFAAYILPGVYVDGWMALLIVSIAMIVVNEVIYPILKLITFPINFITLGLFSLILNFILIQLVAAFVIGFDIEGILGTVFFSLIVAVITSLFGVRGGKKSKSRRRKKHD